LKVLLPNAPNENSPVKWTPADTPLHPLGKLHGKSLGAYELVVCLRPRNRVGARYFQVYLKTDKGEVSRQPVIIGLYNKGKYPSYNWVEITLFSPQVSVGKQALDITAKGLTQQLFQYLADLIPPGGHLMVEYDSPEHQETAHALVRGIPLAVTPLGFILFSVGCGAGFKDWQFAEGGSEGPRKLQGYKALNSQHARLKERELAQELRSFLGSLPPGQGTELESARNRAKAILDILKQ
jgi:hypothetical protein